MKSRIKSVQNIKKITSAMKMVAASKMRKAQAAQEQAVGMPTTFLKLFGEHTSARRLSVSVLHLGWFPHIPWNFQLYVSRTCCAHFDTLLRTAPAVAKRLSARVALAHVSRVCVSGAACLRSLHNAGASLGAAHCHNLTAVRSRTRRTIARVACRPARAQDGQRAAIHRQGHVRWHQHRRGQACQRVRVH